MLSSVVLRTNGIFKWFPEIAVCSGSYVSCKNEVVKCCSTSSGEQPKPLHNETVNSENDVVNPEFINRNPRNLEFLGLAKKSKGWKFQFPTETYYHRLVFENTKSHTTAYVEHCNGDIVVSSSTQELSIARHLYSNRDVSAARNIGRVIALRCLQAGIVNMIVKEQDGGSSSKRFEMFREAVEEGGVDLFEPEEVQPQYKPGIDYDDEEELRDIYDRQLRVCRLSPDHSLIKKLRKIRNYPRSVTRTPQRPISLDNDNHRIKPF